MNAGEIMHRVACIALALAIASGPAFAQFRGKPQPAAECVFDHCDPPGKPAPSRPAAPPPAEDAAPSAVAPGNFDFYVLSLSWSSGFCETNGAADGKSQCQAGANLGFVVHGLWPQYEHGFPSNCASSQNITRQALDQVRGLFPDEGLARYEWRKHGTCSGQSAQAYFADVRRAFRAIRIPDAFAAPRQEQTLAPADILRAFSTANPQLRSGMAAVGCTRGVLQEVRICLSKDLLGFRPCEEVARQSCRTRQVSVPPVR